MVPGKSHLDDEEFLDVFAAPLEQLIGWVEDGEITDVKTTISAYWLDRYRGVWSASFRSNRAFLNPIKIGVLNLSFFAPIYVL